MGRNRIPDIGAGNAAGEISLLTGPDALGTGGKQDGGSESSSRALAPNLPVQGRDNPDLLDQGRLRRRRPRGLDSVLQPHDFTSSNRLDAVEYYLRFRSTYSF